jgi:hypothetical protein
MFNRDIMRKRIPKTPAKAEPAPSAWAGPRIINLAGREAVEAIASPNTEVCKLIDAVCDPSTDTRTRRDCAEKILAMANANPNNGALTVNVERLLAAVCTPDLEVATKIGLALRSMKEITVRALYGQFGSEDPDIAQRAIDTMLMLDSLRPYDPEFTELSKKVLISITDGKKGLD